ncbi:GAF domain-containing protein [Nocardia sp. NPDC050406]|uniref:GAF domain-containing sensor histidine kinase n=1 Tax=Nocardia sp. NPDC050406 TaxID=3364318 RepID=UPI00379FAF79
MTRDPWGAVPEELRELSAPGERLHGLLEAVYTVVSDLDLTVILRQLVQAATRLVDARYGAMGLLARDAGPGEHRLAEFVQVGMDAETAARMPWWPRGVGVIGEVLDGERPVRLDDLTTHPAYRGWPQRHPAMRSFLGVPVRIRQEVFGNLYLADERVGMFTEEDERIIEALAVIAGVKIANSRLYEQARRDAVRRQEDSITIALMRDRDRIARDLHDTVIQRIYAAGLTLEGALRRNPSPEVAERVERAVRALDDTMQDIRATIFSLQTPHGENGLHSGITELVTTAARHLGFTPVLRQEGPIDSVPPEVSVQALAVVRESLSNVVRHADATRIDVRVGVEDGELRITVADNGIGLGDAPRTGGLRNIAERAAALGGVLELGHGLDGRGTRLLWRVPLPTT